MILTLVIVGLALALGAYFLFKDTMNRIQYIECLRIYWITRDTGLPGSPLVYRGFMRQTAAPYWRGEGITFRFGRLTFQVGVLTMRVDSLASQMGSGYKSVSAKEIRKWA